MTVQVNVKGLKELNAKMKRLGGAELAHKTMELYAGRIMADVDDYPPITEANMPPPPYYDRGYGTVTNAGGTGKKTSEMMGRKWKVKTTSKTVTLENDAKYSGFVQGLRQAKFHAERGWKNAYTEAERRTDEVTAIFHDLFRKNWR